MTVLVWFCNIQVVCVCVTNPYMEWIKLRLCVLYALDNSR